MNNKALFIDRDGVINLKRDEGDYVKNWEEFVLINESVSLLRKYEELGYLLVVITNQRGISRGLMSKNDVIDINNKMISLLKNKGVNLSAVYFCPHDICDNCNCRKPKPGLIFMAAKDLRIDISESIMIGDSKSDIDSGKNAGCKKNYYITYTERGYLLDLA